jgi:hypothetical protein
MEPKSPNSVTDRLNEIIVLLCVMGAFASAGFLVLPPIPKYMVNMGLTIGIGVTVVFLAWTSSQVLYVLKVMKKKIGGWNVGWIVRWIDDQIWKIRFYFLVRRFG